MSLLGGIEAGGTKFVCAIGDGDGRLVESERFPTTTPEQTIARAIDFFRDRSDLDAIGIASFGPINRRTGQIGSTPKPGWRDVEFAGRVKSELGVPVAFDTDVNGAVVAERRWGAARGVDDVLYLTVGTGFGGGAIVDGHLIHGQMHPEVGHVRVPHDWERDPFPGACFFHGDCLEGLASGAALKQRWGTNAEQLPPDHPAWALEAHYIALGICNFQCVLSSRLVIVGGGVGSNPALLELVRVEVRNLLKGYLEEPEIQMPGLGPDAGVLGAIALTEYATRY